MLTSSPASHRPVLRLATVLVVLAQVLWPLHGAAMRSDGFAVEICGAGGAVTIILPTAPAPHSAGHGGDCCLGLCTAVALPLLPVAPGHIGRRVQRAWWRPGQPPTRSRRPGGYRSRAPPAR